VDLPLADPIGSNQMIAQEARRETPKARRHEAQETAPIETHADANAASSEATPRDDRPRLLLVEDHPTNRQVIQILLGELVKLDMACDGVEGLSAAQRSCYDLILMDMQMPVMDGLSATRAIRAFEQDCGQPRTPIIMLSANAWAEHVEASFEAGADAHLSKPITADALLAAIDSALTDSASASSPVDRVGVATA
jgi:CheY-like chemotaxis protein